MYYSLYTADLLLRFPVAHSHSDCDGAAVRGNVGFSVLSTIATGPEKPWIEPPTIKLVDDLLLTHKAFSEA